jgi:hypothetical protein
MVVLVVFQQYYPIEQFVTVTFSVKMFKKKAKNSPAHTETKPFLQQNVMARGYILK